MELSRYLKSRLRGCKDGEDNDKSIDNIGGGHMMIRHSNAEGEGRSIRKINSQGNSQKMDAEIESFC